MAARRLSSYVGLLTIAFSAVLSERIASQSEAIDPDEVHNSEVKLRSDLLRSYDINVLPPHDKYSPVKVKLELSILAIRDLDFKQQILTTDCWLKLMWEDSRLKWDKAFYSNIAVVRLEDHKIWQPDIKLYNNVHGNSDKSVGNVYALLYDSGRVIWIPPVTYSTFCEMDIRFYPYDEHECIFKFGSWTHDGYHLMVELFENKTKAEYGYMWHQGGEWEIISSRALATMKTYPCCEEPYPDATFYVTLRRRSPFYKAAVLCPIIAVVCLILTSFWISPVATERIILNGVSLLILVATLMYLSAKLPPAGDNAPLIVTSCSILTMLTVIITILSVVFSNICKSRQSEILPHWIDVVLKSRAATIFCIAVPTSFERFANQNDTEGGTAEDPKTQQRGNGTFADVQQTNRWILFFQLVDRVAFIVCSIIVIAILIAASSSSS